MKTFSPKRGVRPWQNALLATTGLAVFFVLSSLLWRSGHAEWAFLLLFLAIWVLLAVSWSNVSFAEESGSILASIVDRNFEDMDERIAHMERELAAVRQWLVSISLQHEPEQKRPPWKVGKSGETRLNR
jgi:hypothetical protein